MLSIEGIQNGFILDHIPAGKGLELYQLLELEDSSASVALLQNVRSGKCGRKDLIKIEGTELPKRIEILGKVDPNITVNIVQHGEVVNKYHPVPPQRLVNVVRCKNPRCITSIESGCDQIFRLGKSGEYYCAYCGQKM